MMTKQVSVTAVHTIPTDEASIAEGKRIIAYRACTDCRNTNFSGTLFLDDPAHHPPLL